MSLCSLFDTCLAAATTTRVLDWTRRSGTWDLHRPRSHLNRLVTCTCEASRGVRRAGGRGREPRAWETDGPDPGVMSWRHCCHTMNHRPTDTRQHCCCEPISTSHVVCTDWMLRTMEAFDLDNKLYQTVAYPRFHWGGGREDCTPRGLGVWNTSQEEGVFGEGPPDI